jgi:hypothetical protein
MEGCSAPEACRVRRPSFGQPAPPAPLHPGVFLFHTALPRLPPHTRFICICVARTWWGRGAGGACGGHPQSAHLWNLLSSVRQPAPPAPLPPVVFLFHAALPRLPPHTPSMCMCVARAWWGRGAGGACGGHPWSTHVGNLLTTVDCVSQPHLHPCPPWCSSSTPPSHASHLTHPPCACVWPGRGGAGGPGARVGGTHGAPTWGTSCESCLLFLCQPAPPAPLPPGVFLFHAALPRLPPHTPSMCMCVARAWWGRGAGGACVGHPRSTHVGHLLSTVDCVSQPHLHPCPPWCSSSTLTCCVSHPTHPPSIYVWPGCVTAGGAGVRVWGAPGAPTCGSLLSPADCVCMPHLHPCPPWCSSSALTCRVSHPTQSPSICVWPGCVTAGGPGARVWGTHGAPTCGTPLP